MDINLDILKTVLNVLEIRRDVKNKSSDQQCDLI